MGAIDIVARSVNWFGRLEGRGGTHCSSSVRSVPVGARSSANRTFGGRGRQTAGIQLVEKDTIKYTSPSWKSSFHKSVRTECRASKAAAVEIKITRSKPMAKWRMLVRWTIPPRHNITVDALKKKVLFNKEGFVCTTTQAFAWGSH